MKNQDRITKMFVKCEFKCDTRTGWVEIEITSEEMISIASRSFLDQKISDFLAQHERKPS